jgi:hypothetical protein
LQENYFTGHKSRPGWDGVLLTLSKIHYIPP